MRRARFLSIGLISPALLYITAFLAAPAIIMLLLAFGIDVFNSDSSGGAEIMSTVTAPETWGSVKTGLILSIPTVIACLALGLGYAVLASRIGGVWRAILTGVLFLPLLTGELVFGYGWLIILGRNGIVNSALQSLGLIGQPLTLIGRPVAVIVGLIGTLVPFAALPMATAYRGINPELRLAAASLGASPIRTSWHVIAPLLKPAAISGASIVYAISLSAYAVPTLLGVGRIQTLPLDIYTQYISTFNWSAGSSLALILVVVLLIPVLLMMRAQATLQRKS